MRVRRSLRCDRCDSRRPRHSGVVRICSLLPCAVDPVLVLGAPVLAAFGLRVVSPVTFVIPGNELDSVLYQRTLPAVVWFSFVGLLAHANGALAVSIRLLRVSLVPALVLASAFALALVEALVLVLVLALVLAVTLVGRLVKSWGFSRTLLGSSDWCR